MSKTQNRSNLFGVFGKGKRALFARLTAFQRLKLLVFLRKEDSAQFEGKFTFRKCVYNEIGCNKGK